MSSSLRLSVLFVLLGSVLVLVNGNPYRGDYGKLQNSRHKLQNGVQRGTEEDDMTTPQIIQNRGYPAEIHHVTTKDGYILEMHRIPYGKDSGPAPDKPVVFLQHGLLSASSDWILSPVEIGLGYLLADAGYDVWMGNCRGNTYSRKHVSLDPDNDNGTYWGFSFDQIGQLDIPAMLQYVLQLTNQAQLNYVGHSQGTLTFWIAMETNPELNESIKIMFALGPVSTVANMISPLRLIAPYAEDIEWILNNLGIYEFMPSTEFMQLIGETLCQDSSPFQEVCSNVLFLIAGYDPSSLNETMLPLILSHSPAGTSVQNVVHFGQEYNHAYYARYDYGTAGNQLHYGQDTPPLYNAATVRAPVVLMWSQNDWLAVPEDVAWLAAQLPNLIENYRVPKDLFNHIDFIWGVDADDLVYHKILEMLKSFN